MRLSDCLDAWEAVIILIVNICPKQRAIHLTLYLPNCLIQQNGKILEQKYSLLFWQLLVYIYVCLWNLKVIVLP
jgi:hypothetical protein